MVIPDDPYTDIDELNREYLANALEQQPEFLEGAEQPKCNHKEIKHTVPVSFVKNHPDIIRRILSSGQGELILVTNDDGSYDVDEDGGVSGLMVFQDLEDFEVKLRDYYTSPSAAIIDYAKMNNIDLITIGTKGMTGLKQFLLWSVANNVITHAHCPVVAIR